MPFPPHPEGRGPLIIAHRGGAGERVQNTLSAFRACVDSGVDGVEFDVHRAQDGVIVLHHDAWLDRSTSGKGPVSRLSAEALSRLKVNGSNEGLPELAAALGLLAHDPALELHLEIKTDHSGVVPQGLIDRCIEQVQTRGLTDRLVLTSFRIEDLERSLAAAPGLRMALAIQLSTSWMVGGLDALVARGLSIPGCIISLETMLARTNLGWLLEVAPGRLGVWNADDEEDLRFWLAQPVRQIITDRPTLALRLRDA